MAPTWHELPQADLTARQMHDLLMLRHRVFVVEQDCLAYSDIDGRDVADGTHHVLAYDGESLVGYARVLAPAAEGEAARIGRVVVAAAARGTGLGHGLAERAVALVERTWPGSPILLSAQEHLRDFYAGHGFSPVGEVYVEDDIPHLDMVRPPA